MTKKNWIQFLCAIGKVFGKTPIIWKCSHCGRKHLWWWSQLDIIIGIVFMQCDKCSEKTACFIQKDGTVIQ